MLFRSDSGEIIFDKDIEPAYVPQESGKERVKDILGDTLSNSENLKLLKELDLAKIDFNRRMNSLSGGQQSKVYIAKAFSKPSRLFLLDEPTNNLDFYGLKILEDLISKTKKSAFLIVSHDREFLDRMVNRIFEIDKTSHSLNIYDGNYSDYEKAKELEERKARDAWSKQQKEIKKLQRSIEEKKTWTNKAQKGPKITDSHKLGRGFAKDRSRNIAKTMKSLETKLDKIKILGKPREHWGIRFNIDESDRSGNIVAVVNNTEKSIGGFSLPTISLDIQRGDRIVIVGRNGAGKTTLLRLITGEIKPDKGECRLGTGVVVGFLRQIDPGVDRGDIVSILARDTDIDADRARGIIHKFGIEIGGSKKDISNLSPGERMRFRLAIFATKGVNFLVLDEPTNHLDIETITELERVIKNFSGTLLFVSHDRRFIENIRADKVFELNKNGLREFKRGV